MSDWTGLTTRRGNRPTFRGRRRGRPSGANKSVMPKTKKDATQDKELVRLDKRIKRLNNNYSFDPIRKDTLVNGVAAVSDPGTTHTILLNGLVQGDTPITRDKDHVRYTSIQLRGYATSNVSVTTVGVICRIMIIKDKAPNGVALTAANVLDNGVITEYVNAPYNSDYFKRFKILYDRRFHMNPEVGVQASGTTNAVVPVVVPMEARVKLNSITNYGLGNAGTIADISIGSYYLLLLSNQASGSAFTPAINLGIRMYGDDN